jgi:hypothetical protein
VKWIDKWKVAGADLNIEIRGSGFLLEFIPTLAGQK